ncbi:MAG: LysM peptidoglycan-binding domain-containing protein [Lachnospiraceae bacterium]|nr:LysM peptidoglycan-binding domain-containing protein [Lachnospiraceae bacterium]
MIEIVNEGSSRTNKREVPTNVRQIGDVRGKTKIYIEDYIVTFMKQISTRDDKPKALILYGSQQRDGNKKLMFVNGAILADCFLEAQGEPTVFQESVWREVNEKAGHFFQESQVLGWIYLRYDLSDFVSAAVINTHKQFFREDQQIFMEYSVGERIEHLYLFEKGNMALQSGYFVYYERNEAMQNYMITVKQDEPEEGTPEVDKAAKKFRGIVQEKQEEIHRKQTMGILYGTSVAMLLIVTIIGVTMLNNYEKMQSMEKVLYDISAQMTDEEGADVDAGKVEVVTQDAALIDATSDNKQEELALTEEMESEDMSTSDDQVEETLLAAGAEANMMAQDVQILEVNNQSENDIEPVQETMSSQTSDPVLDAQEGFVVPGTYTIEKGDTLERISIKFYGDGSMVDRICELNGIPDKNNILYGVNIVLP